MTDRCKLTQSRRVIAFVEQRSADAGRRARNGELFYLSTDLELLRDLYAQARAGRSEDKWIEDESPLRDSIEHTGLKLVERTTGPLLSKPGVGGGGRGDTFARRWVMAELQRLGRRHNFHRVEMNATVAGEPVDVVWDQIGWQVHLTLEPPGAERRAQELHRAADLHTISLMDTLDLRKRPAAVCIPKVGLRDLHGTILRAALMPDPPPRLTRPFVDNVEHFDGATMTWAKTMRLTFDQFCGTLREKQYTYLATGIWVLERDLEAERARMDELARWATKTLAALAGSCAMVTAELARLENERSTLSAELDAAERRIEARDKEIDSYASRDFAKTENRTWCLGDDDVQTVVELQPVILAITNYEKKPRWMKIAIGLWALFSQWPWSPLLQKARTEIAQNRLVRGPNQEVVAIRLRMGANVQRSQLVASRLEKLSRDSDSLRTALEGKSWRQLASLQRIELSNAAE